MFILLAVIAACALGIGLHYLLPHRETRGVALVPAVATAACALIYTGMQWAGVAENNGWLWLAAIGGGLAIAAIAGFVLSAMRTKRDAIEREALGI